MRVSTQQVFTNAITQMQKTQTDLALSNERIASGKALLSPSDDPVAAAQILKLEREIANTEKFEDNIDVSERRLRLEELILDQIGTATDRVKELTLQAGGATLGDVDRQVIASELTQLQDTIMSLMNTKDAQGEYLFSGSQGGTPPFMQNGDGSFSYMGDDGQRFIQVGSEHQIASSDSGRDAFVTIQDTIQVQVLGQDSSLLTTPTFTDAGTDTEGDLFAAFSETFGDVEVVVSNASGSAAGVYEYTILDSSGQPITDDSGTVLQNITFDTTDATADTVTFGGLSFDLSGLSTSSISVDKQPGTTPDPRVISNEQVLDSTAYLAFVEDIGSDLNIAATLTSNAGAAEYDYVLTDASGAALGVPYVITPAGPITQPTQVTISDGVTDFLSFTVTPPDSSLLVDDQAISVGITGNVTADIDPGVGVNTQPLVSSITVTDPTSLNYSDFAAAQGNVRIDFTDNGGVLEYELVTDIGGSIAGPLAVPADGIIPVVDPANGLTVASFVVDKTVEAEVLAGNGSSALPFSTTLTAQVDTVLSGQADVTLRATEGHHSILQTLEELITVLETPVTDDASRDALSTALATALEEVDISKEGSLLLQTQLGGRLNSLEIAKDVNADFKLFTQSTLSLLKDLDYTEAILEFSLQETALSASQATFARISSLSLFNFI